MAMTALLAMVRKDLRLFFSDRRSVIVAFAVPIFIGAFIGSITGGGGLRIRRGGTLVLDGTTTSASVGTVVVGNGTLTLSQLTGLSVDVVQSLAALNTSDVRLDAPMDPEGDRSLIERFVAEKKDDK